MLAASSCVMLLNAAQRVAACRILAAEQRQAMQLQRGQPSPAAGPRGVARVIISGAET